MLRLQKEYYKNGKLKSLVPYKNGVMNGTAKFYVYDTDGKFIAETDKVYENGKLKKTSTSYNCPSF